jgi:hypothetical protein
MNNGLVFKLDTTRVCDLFFYLCVFFLRLCAAVIRVMQRPGTVFKEVVLSRCDFFEY